MADRRKIRWVLHEFFLPIIPESFLKAVLRCQIFNLFDAAGPDYSDFRLSYRNGIYTVHFGKQKAKFHGDYTPRFELIPLKGYLRQRSILQGDIVVDAGAYVGEFTIFAAQLCGERGRVIAFEPDEMNYHRLMKNIKLNCLNNVTLVKKGLWSHDDTLSFVSNNDFGCTVVRDRNDYGGTTNYIEVVSLDKELERLGVSDVSFIKMDIEGSELEALEGSRKTLSQDVFLAIASYHIVEGEKTYIALEKMLSRQGFICETGSTHLTTCAYRPVTAIWDKEMV